MNIHIVIPDDFSNSERLDTYVSEHSKNLSRSHLKSCAHEILLNGKKAKLSAKIKARDVIDIEYEEIICDDIAPENIPLKIIYEDENVCVINKERGMVTHPAAGNWSGTLVNALLFHWHKNAIHITDEGNVAEMLEQRRPGIVHRLDKQTTGAIITAKNYDAKNFLSSQFLSHHVRKEYIAIVRGRPPARAGNICTHIVRDPKDRKKFIATDNTSQGKFAQTLYHCIAYYGNYTVVRLRLKTGRTHQIRVHLKYLGCPILGDGLYGKRDSVFPDAPLMLHARLLEIRIPHKKKPMIFRATPPDDFLKIHKTLQKKFRRIEPERTATTHRTPQKLPQQNVRHNTQRSEPYLSTGKNK